MRKSLLLTLIGIGLVAAAVQLYATTKGIGTTPDSRIYIEAARRFASDGTFTNTAGAASIPVVHFPPLLPLVLALPAMLGSIDPLDTARSLDCIMLFATVVVAGALIHDLSSRSKVMAIAGTLLTTGLMASFYIYVWAWSEPLFIFLMLLTFLFLTRYASTGRSLQLVLAALSAALACLTRYVGGAFVISVTYWLLTRPWPVRNRLQRAAAFFAIGGFPIGLWLIRNIVVAGQSTDRTAGFHPITRAMLAEAFGTGFIRLVFFAALAAIAASYLRFDVRKAWQRASQDSAVTSLWLSLLIYVLSLIISISFFDSTTPLDNRTLAPALILLIVAVFSTAAYISAPQRRTWANRLAAGLYGIYLLAGVLGTLVLARRAHQEGAGFASESWKNSAAIAYVRNLPPERPVYSNGEEAIYLLTGRVTHALPRLTDENLEQETNAMRREIVEAAGVVVVFAELENRTFITRQQIRQAVTPMSEQQLSDAIVLSLKHEP
jgi:hypothetical protein